CSGAAGLLDGMPVAAGGDGLTAVRAGAADMLADAAPEGTSGCAPLPRRGGEGVVAVVDSRAPMSMRAPGFRLTSAPTARRARSGGSKAGSSSGDGNGNALGVAGVAVPAETSGLPSRGRNERCAMLVSCGSLPRTVPVHSDGTLPALDCTQLLLPATLRPLLHGSRPSGAQYGVST